MQKFLRFILTGFGWRGNRRRTDNSWLRGKNKDMKESKCSFQVLLLEKAIGQVVERKPMIIGIQGLLLDKIVACPDKSRRLCLHFPMSCLAIDLWPWNPFACEEWKWEAKG